MTNTFFIDTNVLLYSRDLTNPAKRDRAQRWIRELVATGGATINLQVINEFCHAALRKFAFLTADMVKADAERLRAWGDSAIDFDTIEQAWDIRERFALSWYDCLLLESARALGCSHFLSEDMQHGQIVNGVTLVNPFIALPGDFLKRD